MPVVFPRIGFVGFRINVISGFNKIVSLLWPAGNNLVLFLDFNDQKRLVLLVFEFHTQFLSLIHSLFHSVLSRTDQSFARYSQLNALANFSAFSRSRLEVIRNLLNNSSHIKHESTWSSHKELFYKIELQLPLENFKLSYACRANDKQNT